MLQDSKMCKCWSGRKLAKLALGQREMGLQKVQISLYFPQFWSFLRNPNCFCKLFKVCQILNHQKSQEKFLRNKFQAFSITPSQLSQQKLVELLKNLQFSGFDHKSCLRSWSPLLHFPWKRAPEEGNRDKSCIMHRSKAAHCFLFKPSKQ